MNTHEAIKSIVNGIWLAELGHNELRVLLLYVSHADAAGVAYPGMERLIARMGHSSTSHMCLARSKLVERGLLEVVGERRRRPGAKALYRVVLSPVGDAPTTPDSGVDEGDGTTPDSGVRPRPIRASDHAQIGRQTTPDSGVRREDLKRGIKRTKKREGAPAPAQGVANVPAAKPVARLPKALEDASPGLVMFWGAWPAHDRKADAAKVRTKWEADGLEERAADIVAHVLECRQSRKWAADDGRYIEAPLVYLNKQTYDAPPPPRAASHRPKAAAPAIGGLDPELDNLLDQVSPDVDEETALREWEQLKGRPRGTPAPAAETNANTKGTTDAAA